MTETSDVAPRNGLGIASLIIGITALLASVSVCGGFVLGAVAAGLGIAGRARVKHGQADNRGVATAGIVLGIAAIILGVGMIAFWEWTAMFNEDYQRCIDQLQNQQYCDKMFK